VRSFARLHQVERGFRPEGAVTFSLALPEHRYGSGSDPRMAAFADEAARRLAALPGVAAAGATQALPFSVDLNMIYVEVAGRSAAAKSIAYVFECTPGYFEAMGIRLLRGRLFDARDTASGARVGIINQSMARRFFGDQDPVGQRIYPPGHPERGGEIVGVVADVRDGRVARLDGDAPLQLYAPLAQNPYDVLTFVVRGRGDDPGLPAAIRAAVRSLDGEQPVAGLRPLGDLVAASIARQRFAMFLFAAFSAFALLLAAIGLYGVMAYTVSRRTAEIGVRVALGAGTGDVMGLVLRQASRLVALGLGIGLVGALLLTRLLEKLLFGVSAHDPLTFAAIAGLAGAGRGPGLPAARPPRRPRRSHDRVEGRIRRRSPAPETKPALQASKAPEMASSAAKEAAVVWSRPCASRRPQRSPSWQAPIPPPASTRRSRAWPRATCARSSGCSPSRGSA
jgi:putative ABC transport system permease protein